MLQSRQSKEMDSVNWATSAAGPAVNRPLRETGEAFFMRCNWANVSRNAGKVTEKSVLPDATGNGKYGARLARNRG